MENEALVSHLALCQCGVEFVGEGGKRSGVGVGTWGMIFMDRRNAHIFRDSPRACRVSTAETQEPGRIMDRADVFLSTAFNPSVISHRFVEVQMHLRKIPKHPFTPSHTAKV